MPLCLRGMTAQIINSDTDIIPYGFVHLVVGEAYGEQKFFKGLTGSINAPIADQVMRGLIPFTAQDLAETLLAPLPGYCTRRLRPLRMGDPLMWAFYGPTLKGKPSVCIGHAAAVAKKLKQGVRNGALLMLERSVLEQVYAFLWQAGPGGYLLWRRNMPWLWQGGRTLIQRGNRHPAGESVLPMDIVTETTTKGPAGCRPLSTFKDSFNC